MNKSLFFLRFFSKGGGRLKVKCIVHEYFDKNEQEYIKRDVTLDVEEKRGKHLISLGLVKEVKVNKVDKATAEK